MEEFLSTVEVFLLAWVVVSVIIALAAVKARLGKHGLYFGTAVGFMAANVAIAERPYGILVIIVEAFVIIALGVCWALGSTKRKIEIDGVGTWDEQGLSCLQPDPATRAIAAAGNARIGVIGAYAGLTDAETRRLAQLTDLRQLQLTGLQVTSGRDFEPYEWR